MLAATLAESSPIVYVAIAGGIFFTVVWAYDACGDRSGGRTNR